MMTWIQQLLSDGGSPAAAILTGGVYAVLLGASVWDIRKREIATWMLIAAGICAMCACFLTVTRDDVGNRAVQALLSLLPGLAMLLVAFCSRGGMGYGDGLMALCVGPCFGLRSMVSGLFFAFLFSALASVILIGARKASRRTTLPFVPFLTAGLGVMHLVS